MPIYTQLNKVLFFVTITVVDWVDVFTRPKYNHIITESLHYCQEHKGLNINAWVLMSNHLHMVAGLDIDLEYEPYRLEFSNVIRDFKKFTSKKIVNEIQESVEESRAEWMMNRFWYAGNNDSKIKNFRFWQEGYHPEEIFTLEFLKQKINYIHLNPVRREIVASPEHYLYGSAIDYAGGKGLLKVTTIELY